MSRAAKRALLIAFLALGIAAVPAAHAGLPDGAADMVWGQPSMTSGGCFLTHVSAATLCHPERSFVDVAGNLWVSDWYNNRVLLYAYDPHSGRPANVPRAVFGQYGRMDSRLCNAPPPTGMPPAPSQYTLCQPNGLAVDRQGTLYVADQANNRILVYFHAARKPEAAPADLVLGQPSFSTVGANDVPAGPGRDGTCRAPDPASACTLNSPEGLALDAVGDLLVADTANNRVLGWRAATLGSVRTVGCLAMCVTPADRVWGQHHSFHTVCANAPARPTPLCQRQEITAATLNNPDDVAVTPAGRLLIADTGNNRVLQFTTPLASRKQQAGIVYGQNGKFDTVDANPGGTSGLSLSAPTGVTSGPGDSIWVADSGNNRVLRYTAGNPAATAVLGQPTFSLNAPGHGPTGLDDPTDVKVDHAGNVYVTDHGANDRVLEYTGAASRHG